MQNIDVRFNATSNFSQVEGDLAALQAQAAALQATFQKMAYAKAPAIVDSGSWRAATAAVEVASRTYRNAASSSGLMTTQQIRANSEAARYTDLLKKQKLALTDMVKHQGIMREAYRDQLRMQRMTAQYWGTDKQGRTITDIAIPRNVPVELDTMRNKIGFVSTALKSAGMQMVNLGKNTQWAGRQLTVGFTYPMALLGAATGALAYQSDAAFAKIAKVYDYSMEAQNNAAVKEKEVAQLRKESWDTAIKAANDYGTSIKSTLDVQQQLAATGLTGDTLTNATREVQRISTLGDIDPTQATEMIIALQTAFRKTIRDGDDLTNILNFMNETSNATSLSLQDIAEATPRAAAGLSQLGVTAEEMTILLVSMREAGVNAAEGANALKSATTRILRPVKQAKDFYAQYNIELDKLSEQSNGNLFDFIRLLGEEQQKITGSTEESTQRLRSQGIAALFGTYQFNRLNAALVNMGDAYAGVGNQTKKAMDILDKGPEQLAKNAESSLKVITESLSGKFNREWQSLLGELTEMGEPFLKIATEIVGVLTDMVSAFNELPGPIKAIVGSIAGIAAVSGPLIMIAGLAMNLTGQFVKGVGSIGAFATKFRLFMIEEKSAILVAKKMNAEFMSQASGASTLAKEMAVLRAAYEQANQAAMKYMASSNMLSNATFAPGAIGPTMVNPNQYKAPIGPTIPAYLQGMTPEQRSLYLNGPKQGADGRFLSSKERLAAANLAIQERITREQSKQYKHEQRAAKMAEAKNRAYEKMNGTLGGVATSFSLAAAASAAMMVSSNETVNNIATWTIVGTLVVPAMKQVVIATAAAAKSAWAYAAGMIAGARANAGSVAAGLVGGARGALAGFGAMMGPIGWTITGVAAVGAGIYAWKKHIENARKEQAALHENVEGMTDAWAAGVGKVKKEYKSMKIVQDGNMEASKRQQLYDSYSKGEMGGIVDNLNSDKFSSMQKDLLVAQHFMELQVDYGLSAQDAAQNIKAMYAAAGAGAEEQELKARELLATLGDVNVASSKLLANQISLFNTKDPGTDEAKAAAKDVADVFMLAFEQASTPQRAKALFSEFSTAATQEWKVAFAKIQSTYPDIKARLKELGIESAEALRQGVSQEGGADEFFKKFFSDFATNYGAGQDFNAMIQRAMSTESMFVKGLAGSDLALGQALDDSINSIDELIQKYVFADKMMTWENAKREVIELQRLMQVRIPQASGLSYDKDLSALGMIVNENNKIARQQAKQRINQINANLGLEQGKTLSQAISYFMNQIAAGAAGAAGQTRGLAGAARSAASALNGVNFFSKSNAPRIMQNAMSGVQDQIANSVSNNFDNRMNSALDAAQESWDNKMAALDRQQQAQMDAFDNRWERRKERVEAYYNRRIEGINNEIKAEERAEKIRQRIFEADAERMRRSAEMANMNIDFNRAVNSGNLDEAAKIRNNAAAAQAQWRNQDAGNASGTKSEARIEKMQKRIDRLEKQREKELKQLQRTEERMRKHLERVQQMRSDALKKQSEDEMNAMRSRWEYDRDMLDERLELFKSYTARNQKDLERWMKKVGLSYDDFGKEVKRKGETWSQWLQESITKHVRKAAIEVGNEEVWESISEKVAKNFLKGLGFKNLSEFQRFVMTGKKSGQGEDETQHGGGEIGSGGSGRGNIPKNYKGLHRSERMVRAQVGEYMVNAKQAQANKDLLEAVNSGNGPMGGAGLNFPGMTAWYARAYGLGIKSGLKAGSEKVKAKAKKTSGGVSNGYSEGTGGRHRPISYPVTRGLHGSPPAVDIAAPTGTPVRAVADGTITRSYDIGGPLPTDSYNGDGPYGSYGRVIYLQTAAGTALYAHLSKRFAKTGQKVKGGATIGLSGNTGNSSGPHLHFGATNGPYAWLRRGGKLRWDNTMVAGHKGETMLSSRLTKHFEDNIINGSKSAVYYVTVDMTGAQVNSDVDVQKAMDAWWRDKNIKKGVRRVVE